MHDRSPLAELPIVSPVQAPDEMFSEAEAAVGALRERYDAATSFLRRHFAAVMAGKVPEGRYRAFYPQVSLTTASFAKVDSRLSFGHVTEPGLYETTITRPDLFEGYLVQQLGLLMGREVKFGGAESPTAYLNNSALSNRLFGYPRVSIQQVIAWAADWVQRGGASLGKPTHFETRDGKF